MSLRGGNGLVDSRTGNTLNFEAGVLEGTAVADIANFEFVNIREIPASMINGDTFILNAAGDFTGTTVIVNSINAASNLKEGDSVTLFTTNSGTPYGTVHGTIGNGMAGRIDVTYEHVNGTDIEMIIGGRSANPAARSLPLDPRRRLY